MARKTKEDAEKTRTLILETALKVFYEKGYSGCTLVDIAKQINLTKGAIYWHFKSKVDLFLELGKTMEEKIETDLADLFSHPGDVENIKQMAQRMIKLIADDPQLNLYYSLVYYRMEWQDELLPVKDFFIKQDAELKNFIVHLFQQAQKRKELSHDLQVRSMANAYLAITDGFLSRILMEQGDQKQLLEDLEFTLDIFFTGLQQRTC